MTSKTIDGVSRELLERIAADAIGLSAKKDHWAAVFELRALLAAPEAPLIVPLSGPKEWLDSHRAAPEAPRQEPYGWICTGQYGAYQFFRKDFMRMDWLSGEDASAFTPLYAAPLSPDHSGGCAGVVLVERFNEIADRLEGDDSGLANDLREVIRELNQ